MASSQNAWHTAGRVNRNSQSISRTPQNRSGTASPAPAPAPAPVSSQPPPQTPTARESNKPASSGNVWAQRSAVQTTAAAVTSGSNGASRSEPAAQQNDHMSANTFNVAEVKAFVSRDSIPAPYRPQEPPGGARGSGGSAWGAKPSNMSNGQPFFTQLAKQVAAFEGGG